MKVLDLDKNWMMHRSDEPEWINAVVPGSVYGDLLRAGKMEDPFWKDYEDEALKQMDYDYEYRTSFSCASEMLECDEVILRFDGLDTIADITLNGIKLGHAENMHRIWEYSVKELIREEDNELRVYFYSPTKYIAKAFEKSPTRGTEDAMNGFLHIRKAHYMFGWDWGAHLPDAGIFRPVHLLGVDMARLDSVEVLQYHEENIVRLHINPVLDYVKNQTNIEQKLQIQVKITDPQGHEIICADGYNLDIVIEHPKRW